MAYCFANRRGRSEGRAIEGGGLTPKAVSALSGMRLRACYARPRGAKDVWLLTV